MSTQQSYQDTNTLAILPEDVPVTMPDLPLKLVVNTPDQFKALGDPLRRRILAIIQYQPATAKQIADRLKVPPGTVGHHLQVLEAAGLVQIVARRLVRGVVAKYYTRAARIFCYEMSREITGSQSVAVEMLTQVRDELADAIATDAESEITTSVPRARLSPEPMLITSPTTSFGSQCSTQSSARQVSSTCRKSRAADPSPCTRKGSSRRQLVMNRGITFSRCCRGP